MNVALCVAGLLLGLAPPEVRADDDWPKLGAEVVGKVRESFFDAKRAEEWAARNAHYAATVTNRQAFTEATRHALAELATSHMGYYTVDDPQYYGLRSIFREWLGQAIAVESIGIDTTPEGFVRVVFAGSPAQQAGLQRGDQIVTADDQPFHPVKAFRGRVGQGVRLGVRRVADGPVQPVHVFPRRIEPHREWAEAQDRSARIIERAGKQVACMTLFSAAGEDPEEMVREAIAGRFAKADALVLDLRNGWGGASPSFLDLFSRATPDLEFTGRDGQQTHADPRWRKPLVVVINGGSRSGKELVAFAVQRNKIGTLVGTRTAGAVVGGQAALLSDGSLLFFAVGDVRVDGQRLEGVGVAPDVEVADALPFAEGRDPQMERALDIAAGLGVATPPAPG